MVCCFRFIFIDEKLDTKLEIAQTEMISLLLGDVTSGLGDGARAMDGSLSRYNAAFYCTLTFFSDRGSAQVEFVNESMTVL